MTRLDVLMHRSLAATLDLSATTPPRLKYIRGHQGIPISSLFGVAAQEFSGTAVFNWLRGLLPDDERVLTSLCHRYGADHPLDLLGTEVGAECAGAVQFCTSDRTPGLMAGTGGLHPLSDDEVAEWLERLKTDSAYRVERDPGAGFIVAGMQPKIALRRSPDGDWALPWGAEPTSHIIKVSRPDAYPHEAVMEHLTMSAAAGLGIPTARTEVLLADRVEAIIVERYDRVSSDGALLRVHQEDFCQASGLPPDLKYQRDGGPGPAESAALLRRVVGGRRGENAVRRYLDLLLMQWLTVHNDAHAKNFSMLLHERSVGLAPLYDACSWLPYRGSVPIEKLRTALKIGRDYRLSSADRASAMARTAARLELSAADVARRAEEMSAALPASLDAAVSSLPPQAQSLPMVESYIIDQKQRARDCGRIAERAARDALSASRGSSPSKHTKNPADPE